MDQGFSGFKPVSRKRRFSKVDCFRILPCKSNDVNLCVRRGGHR
jgi:hypothetical protein